MDGVKWSRVAIGCYDVPRVLCFLLFESQCPSQSRYRRDAHDGLGKRKTVLLFESSHNCTF
jgi:hypothetical protein